MAKALVLQAADDEELAHVAAGPLEELSRQHGARFEKKTCNEVRRNRKSRRALTGVFGWKPH